MIKVTCKITGASWCLSALAGQNISTTNSVHPLLELELAELNGLSVPSQNSDALMYLAAYMHKAAELDILVWHLQGTYLHQNESFTKQWMQFVIPRLARVVNWCALNKGCSASAHIPHIRIYPDTRATNVQEWIESAIAAIELYSRTWTQSGKFARELHKRKFGDSVLVEPDTGPTTKAITRGRSQLDYLERSLSTLPGDKFKLVKQVVFTPSNYAPEVIKQVKSLLLDLGLEYDIADKLTKDDILAKLDRTVLDKVGMMKLLLGSTSAELETETKEITKNYTIVHDGQEFINGVDAKIREAILGKDAADKAAPEFSLELTKQHKQPVREDYPNTLAFRAAQTAWQKQQRGN